VRRMSKVAVLAKMVAQDGKRDEAVAKLQALVDHVASEGGTEVYVMHTSDADPNVIWFYELYTDGDALALHGGSDVMKQVGGGLRDVMAARPEITLLTPVAGKGLSL
jgi:quinol monooxygenase YgiN